MVNELKNYKIKDFTGEIVSINKILNDIDIGTNYETIFQDIGNYDYEPKTILEKWEYSILKLLKLIMYKKLWAIFQTYTKDSIKYTEIEKSLPKILQNFLYDKHPNKSLIYCIRKINKIKINSFVKNKHYSIITEYNYFENIDIIKNNTVENITNKDGFNFDNINIIKSYFITNIYTQSIQNYIVTRNIYIKKQISKDELNKFNYWCEQTKTYVDEDLK